MTHQETPTLPTAGRPQFLDGKLAVGTPLADDWPTAGRRQGTRRLADGKVPDGKAPDCRVPRGGTAPSLQNHSSLKKSPHLVSIDPGSRLG